MSGASDFTKAPLGSKSKKPHVWFDPFWRHADCCQSKLRKRSTEFDSRGHDAPSIEISVPGGVLSLDRSILRWVAIALRARSVNETS